MGYPRSIVKGIRTRLLLVMFFLPSIAPAFAQSTSIPSPSDNASEKAVAPQESASLATPLINAKSIGFSKDGSQQIFEGDVIAIGPQSLITADKIIIDEKRKMAIAEGHVIVLANGQYVTGDRVELWTETGDAKVTNAVLVVNDSSESEKIAQEILGYTSSEIEFEAHRKMRLGEVDEKKSDLRTDARTATKLGQNLPPEMIGEYARYLEQEDLMTRQENPAFAQMSEDRRQSLRRRRNVWEQARLSDALKPNGEKAAYFRLTGTSLERTNGNDLRAKDGVWTPCHCEKDENPAWAFRSSTIDAQPGGYATFKNAILEIKGVPVLYLPWFRVPIKDRRQTGFLMPSLSSDSQSGTVYSQPLFFDLGQDKDVTVKTELFERRGTKFGLEGRYLRRKYSGFQFNLELMRDRLWLKKRGDRQELRSLYSEGLAAAQTDTTGFDGDDLQGHYERDYAQRRARQKSFWLAPDSAYKECVSPDLALREACEARLFSQLRPPENATRGLFRWSGQERLSDRLSVVSAGELYSDRQYSADLYTPESFQPGFDTGSGEKALQPTRIQLHNDQQNYYLGLGSSFGDYVLSNDNFEGYQLPAIIKARSRWYRVGNTGVPLYASTSMDQYRLLRVAGLEDDPEEALPYRSSAWWRRLSGAVIAPISAKTAVQVDYFGDVEARYVSSDDKRSVQAYNSIQTMRTGLRFQLPIDGKRPMPGWLGGSEVEGKEGTRYIQHLMNWSVVLAARPSVVRRGGYGDVQPGPELITPRYFMATDGGTGSTPDPDNNITRDAYLEPYQLVTFATTHRWKIFSELWNMIEPTGAPNDSKDGSKPVMSWEEKARRELLYSSDRPVSNEREMFSDDQSKWFVNRYRLLDTDYLEPVTFSANVSYDYVKERLRKIDGPTRQNRPWSEADGTIAINAFSWSLSDNSRYDIYDRMATRHALSLTPPSVLKTSSSFGYTWEKSVAAETETTKTFTFTKEKSATVVTSLTSPVYTTWSWSQKETERTDAKPSYRQKIGLVYESSSKCWGLGFSREKHYDMPPWHAQYLLQLNVVFMGQGRVLQPMYEDAIGREMNKG